MKMMNEEDKGSSILITGANSGIGRKTLELLVEKGHKVYGCARKKEDLEELGTLPNTTPIKLDVTKPEEIAEAVKFIKKQDQGLYGLVNNAGIANVGPIFTHSEAAMKEMFEINVFGVHRMVLAFFPLLKKSKGRIVNISSISGILTAPFFGLYSMTKHALEAYSDALYQNMLEMGILVSLIEPGNFKSDIGQNMYNRYLDEEKNIRLFMTDAQRKQQRSEIEKHFVRSDPLPEPFVVAEAIYDALFSNTPKPRYLVTGNKEEANWVMRRMFFELAQLNQKHEHSFKEDELFKMLKESLANENL